MFNSLRLALLPIILALCPSCNMLRETRQAFEDDPAFAVGVALQVGSMLVDEGSGLGHLVSQGQAVASRQLDLERAMRDSTATEATLSAFERDARQERDKMRDELASFIGSKLGREEGAQAISSAVGEAGLDWGDLPSTPQGWINTGLGVLAILNRRRLAAAAIDAASTVAAQPVRAMDAVFTKARPADAKKPRAKKASTA